MTGKTIVYTILVSALIDRPLSFVILVKMYIAVFPIAIKYGINYLYWGTDQQKLNCWFLVLGPTCWLPASTYTHCCHWILININKSELFDWIHLLLYRFLGSPCPRPRSSALNRRLGKDLSHVTQSWESMFCCGLLERCVPAPSAVRLAMPNSLTWMDVQDQIFDLDRCSGTSCLIWMDASGKFLDMNTPIPTAIFQSP